MRIIDDLSHALRPNPDAEGPCGYQPDTARTGEPRAPGLVTEWVTDRVEAWPRCCVESRTSWPAGVAARSRKRRAEGVVTRERIRADRAPVTAGCECSEIPATTDLGKDAPSQRWVTVSWEIR